MGFDSSGAPLFAIQDNGDSNYGFQNMPQIRLVSWGKNIKTSWRGWNPTVFNLTNMNYPYRVPNAVYETYSSGLVGCYYTNENGTNLYARYERDSYATEVLIGSGLPTGFETKSLDFGPIYYTGTYLPYQKKVIAMDSNRNIKLYTSSPSINFAAEDFERTDSGTASSFLSGYGRWKRFNYGSPSSGFTYTS